LPGDVEDVLQVPGAEGRIVGGADLGHPEGAGLGRPVGAGNEVHGHIEIDGVRHGISFLRCRLTAGGVPGFSGWVTQPQLRVWGTRARTSVSSRTRWCSRSWTSSAISSRSSASAKGETSASNFRLAPAQSRGLVTNPS